MEKMRGGGQEEKKEEQTIEDSGFFLLDIIENVSVTSNMRYVAFYGCEPSQGVPSDSKLVRVLFGHFWQQAEKNKDGMIYLPSDIISFFGIDGRVEKLIVG